MLPAHLLAVGGRRLRFGRNNFTTVAHAAALQGIAAVPSRGAERRPIGDVGIGDLLGRAAVEADIGLICAAIGGRTVMVTGAGGSIGRELCRQIAALGPARLLLFETSEYALYKVHRELECANGSFEAVPLLGSVCDEARVEEIIGAWRPDIIYHAAAYKHVPLVEHNPAEGVTTNIFGTFTLARAAARFAVPSFVLISTDKAVRPTSVMGATKRVAELAVQALGQVSPQTRFATVRFGNVLGSSGSVVPLFREQIEAGGPVTVTDRRATRFFMTVSEAAELVLQAGAMARGGELFVLDMGEPVTIGELAKKMIELSGLTIRDETNLLGEIEIVEIGLRSGEKLYEELLAHSRVSQTEHPRIVKTAETFTPIDELSAKFDRLAEAVASCSRMDLLAILGELVPDFNVAAEPADWVDLQRGIGRCDLPETAVKSA
jgi:FlaA1/EpsC-like NDP-sugar epimerase